MYKFVQENNSAASYGACQSCVAELDLRQCVVHLEPHNIESYLNESPMSSPSLSFEQGEGVSEDIELPVLEHANLQSEEVEHVLEPSPVGETTQATVVEFLDEVPGPSWSVVNNVTSNLMDKQSEIDLQKFLSRPVLIKSHVWAQTDSYTTTTNWNPWHLFFNSAPIKNKLNNYTFIHCKLKLKFVINASPFYSGCMRFAYSPLQALNGNTIIADSVGGELMPYSQRPGVWIFPQTCEGGELTLPFFYHKNWLDITSAQDTQDMGLITPCLYAPLVSCNGVTGTSVVVNVYAWAEDIHLHAPTTKLALQSSEFDYKPSQIASSVSSAAKSLSRIPMIGPYMKATSTVASGMSSIASMFGFTNVPNMDTVAMYRPSAFPHNTTCEVSVPCDRTTVDPKNEVSVDPRTVGLDGTDELSIAYIAGRESWIGNAILSSSDAIDALTLVSRVTPAMCNSANAADQTKPIQYAPCGYVANMFQFWRGDMIFRFKFICTRFHKGRVRISFDPKNNISTSVPDYTTIFNEVVDIGADQDIEIRVPYSQATTFLNTLVVPGNYNFSGSALSPDTYSNGLITMRVVNPLSGPLAVTAIPVMVFVRAAENIEFGVPAVPSYSKVLTPYALQSQSFEYPINVKQIVAGNEMTTPDPNRYLVHFGEKISSFRPLIHRLQRQYVSVNVTPTSTENVRTHTHRTNRRLKFHGFSATGPYTASKIVGVGTAPYSFSRMGVQQLVSLLFVGQRGSTNFSVNLTDHSSTFISQIVLSRYDTTVVSADWAGAASTNSTTPSVVARQNLDGYLESHSGTALTDQRTQAGLSVNIPYYSNYNFQFVNPTYADLGSTVDGSHLDNIQVAYSVNKGTSAGVTQNLNVWAGYGLDYNFFFFINCPSLYLITPPAGA